LLYPLVFWERIMGAVENKQLFQEIFAGLAVGDGRHFIDSLADDFCWTITGTTAWSGTYRGKEEVRAKLLRPCSSSSPTDTPMRCIGSSPKAIM
jgi:ketosteroid isomerase-like protein